MMNAKPFDIPKYLVWNAWRKVKDNGGTYGIDRESIEAFSVNLSSNLYKIWNRLSSGSYFPPPVRRVEIPKPQGGKRILGVPCVSDRIAQAAIVGQFAGFVEPIFHTDSYGYRPAKSAHDAIEVTSKRCWKFPYLVEYDIVGMFDNISHDLIMKAVLLHSKCPWINLYIERWLKGGREQADGSIALGNKGVPQGSIIGPVLCNLFMHYAFDVWVERNFPHSEFCRYADDGLVHVRSLAEALYLKERLSMRFAECGLEIHPEKTKIVCCSTKVGPIDGVVQQFDFLGFTFRRRMAYSKRKNARFTGFSPAPSKKSLKKMKSTVKDGWKLKSKIHNDLDEIAKKTNPVIRGWYNYYARFSGREMSEFSKYLNRQIQGWGMRKFRKLRYRKTRSNLWLRRISKRQPKLFEHWKYHAVC
jgi:RNA-directed DNA polymerase